MRTTMEITGQVADEATVLDWMTALGTVGAVVIASIAVVITQRSIGRERRHQRLVERHRAAVELLEASEARFEHDVDGGVVITFARDQSPELHAARARFSALLRASEEPLPLNRWQAFDQDAHDPNHTDRVIDHMIATGQVAPDFVGGINRAARNVVLRAEIVETIDELREQINQT